MQKTFKKISIKGFRSLDGYFYAVALVGYVHAIAYSLGGEYNIPHGLANAVMNALFGIGTTIPEIREEDISKLSYYADKEANPLYPVPVLMDASELETFYYTLMEDHNDRGRD